MKPTTLMLIAVTLLWTSSGDPYVDQYQPCTLDTNSSDPQEQVCATGEGATCAIEGPHTDCVRRANGETLCARFDGSEPFCSQSCESNVDCVFGFCQEDLKFCVSDEIAGSVNQ